MRFGSGSTGRGAAVVRRLARHFLSGIAHNDLVAPREDLHATFAGALSFLLVVSAGVTLMFLGKYNGVARMPRGFSAVARPPTFDERLVMALGDEMLLLGGAMAVMAILTVLFWDTLSLDDRDRAVLGPLPVSRAALVAAKSAASGVAALVVAVVLNLLPAVSFPIVVLANTSAGMGQVVRWMGAHALAGLAACAFAFFTLVTCRAAAGALLSSGVRRRLGPPVRFALVLSFTSVLLALPALASRAGGALEAASVTPFLNPLLWFVGLEEVLAGRATPAMAALARAGWWAVGLSAAGACAAVLGGLVGRRATTLEAPARHASRAARFVSGLIDRIATLVAEDHRSRAGFLFTVRALFRSPRHRLYLAGSLGLGLAVAGATIAAAYGGVRVGRRPLDLTTMALAGQLNLIFFLVVGIRLAVTIPADLEAGWVFRFLASPSRERHLAGARSAIFVTTVLPLLLLLAPVHAACWGWYGALVHFAFGVVAALTLLEVVFLDYDRLPLVSAFTPGRTLLSLRFPAAVAGYVLFAYLTPVAEWLLITRAGMFYAWIALFVVVVGRLLASQSLRARRDRLPVFDEGDASDVQRLDLSDAAGGPLVHLRAARGAAAGWADPAGPGLASAAGPTPQLDATLGNARRWSRRADSSDVVVRTARATLEFRTGLVHALRRLRANPGFTAFSVITLALGMGATLGIYSVIYSSVLRPLDVPGLDRIVNVYHADPFQGGSRFAVALSPPDFDDLRRTQTVFSALAAHAPFGQVAIVDGVGEKAMGEVVTGPYFALLGVQPVAGRLLAASDDGPAALPVAVIGERLWRRRFGAAPDLTGRRIVLGGHEFAVIGVAPATFRGVELPNLAPTSIWVPLSAASLVGAWRTGDDRESRWLVAKGRLADGRTVDEAQAQLRVIARRLDDTYPIGRDLPPNQRTPDATGRRWVAVPAADRLVTERADSNLRLLARLTLLAVVLVLLVVCSNLANLVLARGLRLKREVAIRLALGATRWQVGREQVLDAAIVVGAGALFAWAGARALATGGVAWTLRYGPWVSVDVAPRLDLRVGLAALATTFVAMIVVGVVPALQLTRAGAGGLAGFHAGGTVSRGWRGRRLLIASQVAVSVALAAIAGLCVRQIGESVSRTSGLDLGRLAVVRFNFDSQGWPESRVRQSLERLAAVAAGDRRLEAVALTSGLPAGDAARSVTRLATPDRPFAEPVYRGQPVRILTATQGLFDAIGLRITRGRPFDGRDVAGGAPVVVLSEAAARGLFDSTDAVGRQVLWRAAAGDARVAAITTLTVVGVVPDAGGRESGRRPDAVAYLPFAQHYDPSIMIVARASHDAGRAVATLEAVTRRLYPDLGIIEAGTAAALAGVENVAFEVMGTVAAALGLIALVLAMVGLYGVLSCLVAQRTHEIGVRLALGASAAHIGRLVLAEGIRPVVEGLVAGFVAADLAEMITTPVFVKPLAPMDPTLLAVVPVPFLVAACLACLLPARRAARSAPTDALRET